MKNILFIIILILNFTHIYSQNDQSKWQLGFNLSHFDRQKDGELNLGDIGFNINPGLEFLHTFYDVQFFKIKTGVAFQHVIVRSHIESDDRFTFGELSLPILIELFPLKERENFISTTMGIYIGQFLYFSWDEQMHGKWNAVSYKDNKNYSEKNIFVDSYFDISIKLNTNNKSQIVISPFIQFRFIENWMEHYRTSTYYGIKFKINLKNKK